MGNPDLFRANRNQAFIACFDAFLAGRRDFPQLPERSSFKWEGAASRTCALIMLILPIKSATKRFPGKAVDFGRLVDLLDIAAIHHGYPMRQCQRFILRMSNKNKRNSDFLLKIDKLDLHFLTQFRV